MASEILLCQSRQMLQAGGFMPLGQQSALAVQPRNPLTGLFSAEEESIFCLLSSELLYVPTEPRFPFYSFTFSISSNHMLLINDHLILKGKD